MRTDESAEKSKGYYVRGEEDSAQSTKSAQKSAKKSTARQSLKKGKTSKKKSSPRFASDEEEATSREIEDTEESEEGDLL